jgi:hypothetical protein
MKSPLSFTCPTLQKIDSEAASVITNHLLGLNRISNNIKAMETSLEKAAIPFTFIYVVSSTEKRFVEHVSNGFMPYQVEFIESTDDCIVWGKTENRQS